MPRLMIELTRDEFDWLRNRAVEALRHPRDEARLIIRDAVATPPQASQASPLRDTSAANETEGKAGATV